MSDKIEEVSSYIGFYDDGKSAERLDDMFESTVYKNFDEFDDDLERMAKNEDYTHALSGEEPTEWSKKRSPEERSRILAAKIAAERRYDQHLEEGGTDLYLMPSPLWDEDVHQ